ncbi:DNA mismatch repair protein MSH4 isoform X2 [Phalaenopsis equestris]|uniref:DNA mismatch repair protein MSH4 isoform X2 n=1 Tax=Phalaenopsis equestris TaxID=78828 RepID=UPI0009E39274|nr:DNA mismatch repair protein MSH4 isoform X2 [Phalaenopsis equestris]
MEEDGGAGDRSSFVIGLIENRAKEVGMAAFDLRSASLHLSQYIETSCSYQNTKTLLLFYDPMTIIVPPVKLAPDGMVGVSELVDKHYPSNRKITVPRGCFDDTKGTVLVRNLAAKEPSALGLDSYHKQYYLCLAAASATIKWIEEEKGVIVTSHSLSVSFNGSFDHMNIDATSVHNLEIIEPLCSEVWGTSNKKRSLFQMLKTTKTVGGARLLRANLLQPLKDIGTINARLDCLDELMSNAELFFGLVQVLRKFPKETDKVLCHFCFKTTKVNGEALKSATARKSQMLISNIIILKTALDALPLLSKVLKNAKSCLLCNIYKSVCENEKYTQMRKRIGDIIDEDVVHARASFVSCTQQCFAIKVGVDGLLDVARRSFCDTSEAIHELANKYRKEFNLQKLKIPFNNRQGFYFSIPLKEINGKLPEKFIKVMRNGKNIHCSSFELASLNVRNKSAAAECFMRTEMCLEGLIDAIREDISLLTLLAEIICLLDMIVNSFAHMISTKPPECYSRPEFTASGPMAIDAGKHPIVENLRSDFVVTFFFHTHSHYIYLIPFSKHNLLRLIENFYMQPNNLFLSEVSNVVIVMGPNMSGKSTYLQQVCLLIILAQIGCYVPARFASIRVVDRMFTRIGSGDNVEYNTSTFMNEMKETSFLMQNVTARSLIVIDELGRSTSTFDGFAIAWSCCEYLLSLKAYTIFATHMEALSEIADIYPNVKVLHFEVDLRNNHLDFKFHLRDGLTHVPHYGLLLAGVAGLPASVVKTARDITARITEKDSKKMTNNCEEYHPLQMAYRVAQRLVCLKYSNQGEDDIRRALENLKESYNEGRFTF